MLRLFTEKIPFHPHFKRAIGLFPLVLFGLGNTIEASIFVLLGEGASVAGALLPLSFILGGVLAFMAAFIYARVALINPVSGADISFIFDIFNQKFLSFSISWLIILGDLAFIALNALGLGIYLSEFIPSSAIIIAIISIFIVTAVNLFGIKKISTLESTLISVLLILLAIFTIQAILPASLDTWFDNYSLNNPPIWLVFSGAVLIFSTFIGYEDIISVSGEVINPKKTIPKALLLTVVITTILYTGLAFLLVSNLSLSDITRVKVPLILLAQKTHFPVFLIYVSLIIAVVTTLISNILVASRKFYALINKTRLAPTFLKLNKQGTPNHLIILVSMISMILIISGSIRFVALITSSVYLIGLISTAVGVLLFEKRKLHLGESYNIPFYPFTVYLVILVGIILILAADFRSLLSIIVWFFLGAIVFFILEKIKKKEEKII
ncbi:MAG: hypothetical protein A2Z11_00995 [Candidatus Woykebacteria bacterium RBG_16_43_9]|uniref:Amino acid permease/ SLC12A domain-containing protein n=1 Tax=Candidatus Woykebacteria bacterium RBG_16_43_9 TaxID=1802596 RepID=A0A1G1WC11_9BACT|nr:MAG: hypothetical protein A2Z11_00995 [Candidatus Woykebacteria bacterium RBG_16_43_9]